VDLKNLADLIEDLFNATDVESAGKENVAIFEHQGTMLENGTVSSDFLSKLRTEIALVNIPTSTSLSKIPVEVLSRLMSILEQQIQLGSSITLKANTVSNPPPLLHPLLSRRH
jgi:hypothetical protein